MFLLTWLVPPAMDMARKYTRSRPHDPVLAAGPSTWPATSAMWLSHSLQTSLAKLVSGPASRPCSSPDTARSLSSLRYSPSK